MKKIPEKKLKKIVSNGALLCGAPLLSQIVMAHQIGIVMAHYRCAITIWDTNGVIIVAHL